MEKGDISMKFVFRSNGLAHMRTKEMRKKARAKEKVKKENSKQEQEKKSVQRQCTRFLRNN
jgi:hypothetical protein